MYATMGVISHYRCNTGVIQSMHTRGQGILYPALIQPKTYVAHNEDYMYVSSYWASKKVAEIFKKSSFTVMARVWWNDSPMHHKRHKLVEPFCQVIWQCVLKTQ